LLVVGGTQCFRAHLESEGHGDASIRKFRTGKDAAVEVGKGGAIARLNVPQRLSGAGCGSA